jgi:hypothetical protein
VLAETIRLQHLALLTCIVSAHNDRPAEPESPAVRIFFYVGGGYSDDGSGGHIFKDQMYVEKLSPVSNKRKQSSPIVFIHGQGQTGQTS